jgi:hypothetical protein
MLVAKSVTSQFAAGYLLNYCVRLRQRQEIAVAARDMGIGLPNVRPYSMSHDPVGVYFGWECGMDWLID